MNKSLLVDVLIPPCNPTVEKEVRALLSERDKTRIVKYAEYPHLDLRARLREYYSSSVEIASASNFRGDVLYIACTAASYPIGVGGDREWTDRISAVTGAPVVSAAGAVGEVLRILHPRKITLVSPYPEWLTHECVNYWESAGNQVLEIFNIDGSGAIYDLSVEKIINFFAVNEKRFRGSAVVVAGTGAPTLAALDNLVENRFSLPILSSQLAGVWVSYFKLGIQDRLALSPSLAMRDLHSRLTSLLS